MFLNPQVTWNNIRELVLNQGGAKLIKKAVNNIYECNDFHKQVLKAFAQGKKPPVNLSDEEKR
jgi:hypothetical protein